MERKQAHLLVTKRQRDVHGTAGIVLVVVYIWYREPVPFTLMPCLIPQVFNR